MDPLQNPYRPGVGLQPTFLAGRETDIEEFRRVLDAAPAIPGNVRMTGLRGVGKTVLLRHFQELAETKNWSTFSVELEPRHCSDESFRDMIQQQCNQVIHDSSVVSRVREAAGNALATARRAISVSYEGFTWTAAGDLDQATKGVAEHLLGAVVEATKSGRMGLVVLFDEAQILVDDKSASGSHPLSTLVAAVSTLQKQAVPVSLVLCGLPTLAVNLLTARTYTERMFRGFKIASLGDADAREAFTKPLEGGLLAASQSLVEQVASDVDGYPYFIQLWGAELWDATVRAGLPEITVATLAAIEDRIQRRLDLDFYEPRIESLTPAEQDLLMASATCDYPPLTVSDLNGASSKSNDNINVLLGRLVKANVLYRPRKGQYRYTAPKFRDFLLRRSDEELGE